MDSKHIQGVNPSSKCSSDNHISALDIRKTVWKSSSIQNYRRCSKGLVPNLSFLGIGFLPDGIIDENSLGGFIFKKGKEKGEEIVDQAIQDTAEKFSLSEFLGIKDKIKEIAEEMHRRALLTPDPNDDSIDYFKYLYSEADRAVVTHFAPDWFKDMIIYCTTVTAEFTHNSVQKLIELIYKLCSTIVLWTPEWFFDNDWFPQSVGNMTIISVGLTVLMTMIEGLKRIIRMKHTPYRDILKKLPIALTVSALAPSIFLYGVKYLNKLTGIIMKLGANTSNHSFSILSNIVFDPLNILMMLVFAILFLATCIPMTYFHAKRWFSLILTAICTPLAMSAMLFESTEKYFRLWLTSVKEAGTKQLIFAALVSILGFIMFASPNPTTITGSFTKLVTMLGGLHLLAYPPSFVTNAAGYVGEKNWKDMYQDMKRKYDSIASIGDKKNIKKVDNSLIGSAKIAGKVYRFLFK